MIQINIAGDFCPQGRITHLIKTGKGGEILAGWSQLLTDADYNVVNLEAPVTKEKMQGIKKVGPVLGCPPETVSFLKKNNFHLLTLANNHFRDYGDEGVNYTLELCRRQKLDTVGGGKNLQEASQILYKEIKGKIIAFVNVCETEFSIASTNNGGSNPLDIVNNYCQISEAKLKSDYTIVIVHGGHEGYQLPSPRMKRTYRFFVDAGANAVIAHHPHCYSGYEEYKGVPIFYSIGNFCFDDVCCRNDIWNEGYVVSLCLEEKITFKIHPYIQCNDEPVVRFMNEEETIIFNQSIEKLNSIIADDRKLEQKFDQFVLEQKRKILFMVLPYSNRIFLALYKRKLLPHFLRKIKKMYLLNALRCESHRDIIVSNLQNMI